MITLLKYVSYVPSLIFMIQAVVSLVESIKNGEPGTEKKNAALDILGQNWESLSKEFKIVVPFDVLKPVISFLIDLTVSVYNMIGYFRKKDNPA